MEAIELTVNGETMSVAREFTVADLVEKMALTGKRIAVELRGGGNG